MKKTVFLPLLTCAVGLALCPAGRAQDSTPAPATSGTDSGAAAGEHYGHHGGKGGEMLDRLTTQLSLTPDQVAQIKPILQAAHEQIKSTREDTSLSQDQKMSKIKDAWSGANSQIEGILTADQKTKFDAMKEKMHEHRHYGQGEADASPSAAPSATP